MSNFNKNLCRRKLPSKDNVNLWFNATLRPTFHSKIRFLSSVPFILHVLKLGVQRLAKFKEGRNTTAATYQEGSSRIRFATFNLCPYKLFISTSTLRIWFSPSYWTSFITHWGIFAKMSIFRKVKCRSKLPSKEKVNLWFNATLRPTFQSRFLFLPSLLFILHVLKLGLLKLPKFKEGRNTIEATCHEGSFAYG